MSPFSVCRMESAALLASKVGEKGYYYKVGRAISLEQRRNNKSTKAFRVILTDNQLKPTAKENIQTVHDVIGREVDRVFEPFTERLKEHFRRLRRR